MMIKGTMTTIGEITTTTGMIITDEMTTTIGMRTTVVVQKTGFKQNQCKGCVNWPLHTGAYFELYIVRDRLVDVNILGSTHL